MTQQLTVNWIDANGAGSNTHYFLIDGADPSALISALQAHSRALLAGWSIGTYHVLTGTPSPQPFGSLNDIAGLRFCEPNGPCLVAVLPAPNIGIFFSNDTEVDTSQISDIITAGLGVLCDIAGDPVSRYDTGYRTQRRRGDF